jgi:hypothetical protein
MAIERGQSTSDWRVQILREGYYVSKLSLAGYAAWSVA